MLWHILTTAPQREMRAQELIEAAGLEVMLPVEYRWHDVRRGGNGKKGKTEKVVRPHVLWPRYVFAGSARFGFPWRDLYSMNADGKPLITGALYHNGMPYALSHTEHLRVLALCDIEEPSVSPDAAPRLAVGDKVRINSGPFAGQIARVTKTAKNKESIRAMVSLFGMLTEATVPTAMVEAA